MLPIPVNKTGDSQQTKTQIRFESDKNIFSIRRNWSATLAATLQSPLM